MGRKNKFQPLLVNLGPNEHILSPTPITPVIIFCPSDSLENSEAGSLYFDGIESRATLFPQQQKLENSIKRLYAAVNNSLYQLSWSSHLILSLDQGGE